MSEDFLKNVTVLRREELPSGKVLLMIDHFKDGELKLVPRFAVYELKGKNCYFAFGSNEKKTVESAYKDTLEEHRKKHKNSEYKTAGIRI